MKRLVRTVAQVILCVCFLGAVAALAEVPTTTLVIAGTRTAVGELVRDLAWSFDVEERDGGGRLTLDTAGAGPRAARAAFFSMKSKKPYERSSEGAIYLRIRLDAFGFESAAAARHALDAFKARQLKMAPAPGMICKGARYRAQKGPRVYVLDVGCLFSRANYEVVVKALKAVLSESDASGGYAIQCFCGGGAVERSLGR